MIAISPISEVPKRLRQRHPRKIVCFRRTPMLRAYNFNRYQGIHLLNRYCKCRQSFSILSSFRTVIASCECTRIQTMGNSFFFFPNEITLNKCLDIFTYNAKSPNGTLRLCGTHFENHRPKAVSEGRLGVKTLPHPPKCFPVIICCEKNIIVSIFRITNKYYRRTSNEKIYYTSVFVAITMNISQTVDIALFPNVHTR